MIRPRRRDQYRSGKFDPIDAEVAARAVLAGTVTGRPKDADGEVEIIRALGAARRSAVKRVLRPPTNREQCSSPLPKG